MAFVLEDIPVGHTFDQFCGYFRLNVISDDLSSSPPSEKDLRRLFDLYDLDRDGILSSTESQLLNVNLIHPINALRSALIVVDFQNDFVAGSLAIKHGPARQDPIEALEPLNHLLERCAHFKRIIYTLDWHPSNHISFYEHCRNSDRTLSKEDKVRKLKPFDTVHFDNPNFKQTLYPTHCVQNSWGAELCPDLIRAEGAKYVQKGSQVFVDAYSGFVDNQGEYRSELEPILREEKIEALFICGLALDICVAATARDAAKLKFLTAVIVDCSKGLTHEQIDEKNEELRALNVAMVDSDGVEAFIDSKRMPWRWVCQLVGLSLEDHKREFGLNKSNVHFPPVQPKPRTKSLSNGHAKSNGHSLSDDYDEEKQNGHLLQKSRRQSSHLGAMAAKVVAANNNNKVTADKGSKDHQHQIKDNGIAV